MTVHVLNPAPGEYSQTFGGVAPRLTVQPGDLVEVHTEDCFGGRITSPDQIPSRDVPASALDAVSGPIAVDDAEPGDLLAVHIVSIRPSRPYAISVALPGFGALAVTAETAMLHEPLEERVWFWDLDLDAWTGTFHARNGFTAELPLDPMYGTIGVAPASGEVRLVVVPSTHGGNMDSPELRAGTTLYLPVNVPGAMLSLGDGHARQGEGELIGSGLESAMDGVLAVDVVKGAGTDWPRYENDDYLMSTGSVRPLDDAFRVASKDMVGWVHDLTGMDVMDSYQLVSQAMLAPLANMVDPNFTFVVKMPKTALGQAGQAAYGGAHAKLAALGREYLASK